MTSSRRAVRRLALGLCFCGALAAVIWGATTAIEGARLGRPTLPLDYGRIMRHRLPALAETRGGPLVRVAFLGDSQVVSYPAGRTLPARLGEALDRLAPPHFVVHDLGVPGSGPFDYYFLADEVADARPDLVLASVNLDHFSDAWRAAYSRPALAGFVAPARLVEALSLPLHWTGVTADHLLFDAAVVRAGGFAAWLRLALAQAKLGRARDRLADRLSGGAETRFREAADARTLAAVFSGPDLHHYRRAALEEHYAAALAGLEPDHPALLALGAWVSRLRERGAAVLVYLAPIDVEYLRRAGVHDAAGLARTSAALRRSVEAAGGVFLDLHDRLPSEAFRDAPGHLAFETGEDWPERLAALLAPEVSRAVTGP